MNSDYSRHHLGEGQPPGRVGLRGRYDRVVYSSFRRGEDGPRGVGARRANRVFKKEGECLPHSMNANFWIRGAKGSESGGLLVLCQARYRHGAHDRCDMSIGIPGWTPSSTGIPGFRTCPPRFRVEGGWQLYLIE